MSKMLRGLKNASYLTIGHLLIQIISFIGFIFIARFLGPSDYGIYVTVGSFVGIFEVFVFKGLDRVVLREGSKDESSMHILLEKTIGLRNLLIIIAIATCILTSFITPYDFQTKFYIILFSSELFYLGINTFILTIYQATEEMKYISIFGIMDRILFVSFSIILLYFGFGLLSLFLIALFSRFSILIIKYKFSKKFVKFKLLSKVQFDKKLIKPALVFSLIIFISSLASRIDLLMISFLGTSKDVGIYGASYKIASQGIRLRNLSEAAFFPIFVKQFHNNKKIKAKKLIKYFIFLFGGIFVLCVSAFFYSESIITFLFGNEFKESGKILKILIFYLAFWWATLPFTTGATATNNEKFILIAWSVMAGLNIPLNYLFFLKFGLIGIAYSTLVVYSIGSSLMCGGSYFIMRKQGYLV